MNILISVGIFWLCFFIFMKVLEGVYPDNLYSVLDRVQISISVFSIRWRTTSLNSFFHSMGTRGKGVLKHWFLAGVFFGFIAMVLCVMLLLANIFFVVFLWKKESQQVNGVLTPVIPGVNVPTSHLGYYVLALLVAGVLHEFGHAFAAVSEKCRINAFGMFLMGVYPGAFVDIGEGIEKLSPLSQLRIYCGGAWHNAVLALGCFVGILLLPILVSPLYRYSSEGPYIVSVHPDSVFAGRVFPGDSILGIGRCDTKTARDYENCIVQSFAFLGNNSVGYCVKDGVLADYGTQTYECFDYAYNGPLQGFLSESEHYCMVASDVMQYPLCHSFEDSVYGSCQCVFPRLAPDVALLQLRIMQADPEGGEGKERGIAFVGTPQELWYSFTVRDYAFRIESLSWFDIDLPYIIDRCLRYLASISGALAILNMAPVYYLDGEWCLRPFLLLLESFLGVAILSQRTSPTHFAAPSSPTPSSPTSIGFSTAAGGMEEGGKGEGKGEEDRVVKNILRAGSVLFVVNIALSLINLAST
jgi:S2P endopeptidase